MDPATLTTIISLSTAPQPPAKKPAPNPQQHKISYVQPANKDHQIINLYAPRNNLLEPYKNDYV